MLRLQMFLDRHPGKVFLALLAAAFSLLGLTAYIFLVHDG